MALAQLIASYIDQILKTRVDIDRVVKDDEVADAEFMEGEFGIATGDVVAGFTNPYGGCWTKCLNGTRTKYRKTDSRTKGTTIRKQIALDIHLE